MRPSACRQRSVAPPGQPQSLLEVAPAHQRPAAPVVHQHFLREVAQRLPGHDLSGLLRTAYRFFEISAHQQTLGASGQREHGIEGMPHRRRDPLRFEHHFPRAVGKPGNPLGEAARPVQRESQRIVVGVCGDAGMTRRVIDASKIARVPSCARVVGLPEQLASRGHVVDHRQLGIVGPGGMASQGVQPAVGGIELGAGPVVHAQPPQHGPQRRGIPGVPGQRVGRCEGLRHAAVRPAAGGYPGRAQCGPHREFQAPARFTHGHRLQLR